jgi:hypothetical protein
MRGPTVGKILAARPFTIAEVIGLLRERKALLEHAHARHVIHHGLNPDVLTRADDGLRVTDWSTASIATGEAGTAEDIRALGAVAYQALTRCPPTIPAARRCPGAPARLTSLIDRMLGATPATGPDRIRCSRRGYAIARATDRAVEPDDGARRSKRSRSYSSTSRVSHRPSSSDQGEVVAAWPGHQARLSQAAHEGKKTP